MKRWVCARRAITGNPDHLVDALRDGAPQLLQAATGVPVGPPGGDGSFDLALTVAIGGAELHKTVRATVGEITRMDHWATVPLTWAADAGGPLFPTFEGAIEVEVLSASAIELCVVGHYRPPLGPIGGLGDVTVLADVAQRTIERLVHTLARALIDRVYGDAPPPSPGRTHALRVRDIMQDDGMLTFAEDTALRAAAALLLRARVSGGPVLGEDGRVVGVLSSRDLLDKAAHIPHGVGRASSRADRHFHATTVGEACTRPARVTAAMTPVRDAASEMAEHDIDRLVVLDGATVVGIVTRTDVLRALIRDDDDIADAVRAALGAAGRRDGDILVDVVGGVVELRGLLVTRSLAQQVVDRVQEVDGVIAVDRDELRWEFDDVAARVPFS